jgi:N6-adenosine-specific RNA methylase IME4
VTTPGTKYRTIVADPPWEYPEGFARSTPTGKSLNVKRDSWAENNKFQRKELPYEALSVEAICALPVPDMAERDARLFLWTTNKWLPASFEVMAAWDFEYCQTLVWNKAEGGPFITSVAPNTAEFIIVGSRGSPERIGSFPAQVLRFPAKRKHSTKPDGFADHVEQVSPGPYLEMFARRQRLGWDTWGNEALEHVELSA